LSSFAALYVFTESDVSQFVQQEEYIESDSMHKRERFELHKYQTKYSTELNVQSLGKNKENDIRLI
jgi:hypothetical protein